MDANEHLAPLRPWDVPVPHAKIIQAREIVEAVSPHWRACLKPSIAITRKQATVAPNDGVNRLREWTSLQRDEMRRWQREPVACA